MAMLVLVLMLAPSSRSSDHLARCLSTGLGDADEGGGEESQEAFRFRCKVASESVLQQSLLVDASTSCCSARNSSAGVDSIK